MYVIRHKTECNHNEIMNVINTKDCKDTRSRVVTYTLRVITFALWRLHTNPSDWIKKEPRYCEALFLVRETGLEPVRDYHTPLKRARLPIPPLSRVLKYYTTEELFCQQFF